MQTEYTLEEILRIDREWTNRFMHGKQWLEHELSDPIEDLEVFFHHLQGGAVLDAGCGWARYISRLTNRAITYTGIDHSEEALHVARSANPHLPFHLGSIHQMPFENGSFDGIWSCCALGGFPKKHITEVLAEHRRVLKKGGIMMIVFPLPPFNESEEGFLEDDSRNQMLYHAYYDLEEFCGYVLDAGFQIIKADIRYKLGAQHVLSRAP